MRWEDERYVRLYTRDTIDWQFLSFEAQGLFALLLRKVDRAGILEFGRHGVEGIAAAIGHADRWDTLKPALAELVADRCVALEDTRLLLPNFIEAQEAKTSDRERQRKSRESARVRHTASQAVTSGHTPSQTVTPSLAVPSRTKPAEPAKEDTPTSADADHGPPPEALQELWNSVAHEALPRWQEMTPKRRPKAKARLKERSLEAWRGVIERINRSAFCRGESSSGWLASPDWLLQADTATKVLEGKYDGGTGPPRDIRKGVAQAEDIDWNRPKTGPDPF